MESPVTSRPAPESPTEADLAEPDPTAPGLPTPSALSRRGFLRVAGVAGLTGVAAGVAACTSAAAPVVVVRRPVVARAGGRDDRAERRSQRGSQLRLRRRRRPPRHRAPSAAPSADPNLPAGWTEHDIAARDVVRRFIGNLAPAFQGIYGDEVFAKLADMLGADETWPDPAVKPSFAQVPQLLLNDALSPLEPELDGNVKVFRITVDEIEQQIDELKPTVAALGFNGQTPGPTIRVNEGDRVRAIFTNNLKETTGIHFHGVEFDDFFMDGVPFVTQKPFAPGESFTYEFTANRPGSLMYHSHHNATDQVGRGLLGAFIVDPANPTAVDRVDRDYVWISNDVLGGFTINGHGFPAVVPILAAVGETVRIRFMNEGIMYHPFHGHGYRQRVVARDGYALGNNAYDTDTFTVGPGERWDINIEADRLGLWAYHCHILPHVEGPDGMFGMVNVLIVVPTAADVDAIVQAALA